MSKSTARFLSCAASLIALIACAQNGMAAFTVNGTDDIFAAGQSSVPGFGLGGGTLPPFVAASGGQLFQITAAGSIASGADSGQNNIPPDGQPGQVMNINAPGSPMNLSGYHGPSHALTAVFLAGSPPASTPATLDFSPTGLGSSFTSVSPGIGQIFFVGDGLTGLGTGSAQNFIAPATATRLFFGIADSNGDGNPPSNYSDNAGSFTVTAVPEPTAIAGLALGMILLGRFRKRQA